ncbi:MAG: UvrD-helicase domain-containing protein, partial [Spirochaetota bacterium]
MSSAVGQVKLALSAEFLESFSRLEKTAQAKVRRFMTEFQQNPDKPGFNFEKIHTDPSGNLRSVRVTKGYRGILLKPDSGDVFVFLWVDKHDDAYKWAEGRRVSIHPQTGTIQIFPTEEAVHAAGSLEPIEDGVHARATSTDNDDRGSVTARRSDSGPKLFDPYTDEELLRIGVPEELIELVRSVRDDEDFGRVRRRFPPEAAEALEYLSAGISYSEVLDELGLSTQPQAESVDTSDFAAALDNSLSRRSVMVISSDQELQDALDYPLEKWRIFLHPQQQRLVNVNARGPYRIHGGAGTGKTVIAMHRARKLVRDVFSNDTERVLFTTFTRNLANDIRRNLEKLCSRDELERIEVANIDGWATQFLKRIGYQLTPVEEHERRELWDTALIHKDESLDLSDSFFLTEWDTVIQEQGIRSSEEYLSAR